MLTLTLTEDEAKSLQYLLTLAERSRESEGETWAKLSPEFPNAARNAEVCAEDAATARKMGERIMSVRVLA